MDRRIETDPVESRNIKMFLIESLGSTKVELRCDRPRKHRSQWPFVFLSLIPWHVYLITGSDLHHVSCK